MQRKTPDAASVANAGPDGRLYAPAAARNSDAIIDVLRARAPRRGRALEIASGTGEHIIRFAAEFADLIWQPTDIDMARCNSIRSWAAQNSFANLLDPLILDATQQGWAARHGPFELIILINLLHLISTAQSRSLIADASRALAPGGVFLIYGPFLRGRDFASDGDRKFHQTLAASDPEIGYKSFQDIQACNTENGLLTNTPTEMPANNLMLVAGKPR